MKFFNLSLVTNYSFIIGAIFGFVGSFFITYILTIPPYERMKRKK